MFDNYKSTIMKTKLFSSLFMLFFSIAFAQIPTNGLLHEFRFNNTTTNESATKFFINSNTGNTTGITYGFDRFGNANAAVAKSGSAYLYNQSLDNLPQGNSSRSISIWIKPDLVNADNIIFTCGTANSNLVYGSSFNLSTVYNFTYSANVAATNPVLVGHWKHVVLTYNGTVSKVFINGNLVNQGTLSLNTTGLQFYLGSLFNTTPSMFSGLFDDLLIYNRELTPNEVNQIYNFGATPICEYNFNNTYNNVNNSYPFVSNSGTSFGLDRNGNLNNAIYINNTGTSAFITNLPYGNNPRTIAFWAKLNTIQTPYNMTFSYGTADIGKACGGSFNASNVEFFGYANNLSASITNGQNEWCFFTYTYDGTNAKIYKNGLLLTTVAKNWNTTANGNLLYLGVGVGGEYVFNGAIDDLKVYNYVLSDMSISNLYNNNTLSSSDFSQNNLEVALYPNPVQDLLNINVDNAIKSVEIYNIQGQKVLNSTSNEVDMSSLNSGIYLVKITDENNSIATKKVVKR